MIQKIIIVYLLLCAACLLSVWLLYLFKRQFYRRMLGWTRREQMRNIARVCFVPVLNFLMLAGMLAELISRENKEEDK
jgi:hypothetical protein